jgi:hypothetical protein
MLPHARIPVIIVSFSKFGLTLHSPVGLPTDGRIVRRGRESNHF